MSSDKKKNPGSDAHVTERLCKARQETLVEKAKTLEEKISGLRKSIYIAFAVSMAWVTVLEFVLTYLGAR